MLDVDINDSKYRDAESFTGEISGPLPNTKIKIQPFGDALGNLTLAPGVNVDGEAIGLDKLGHFAQHGYKFRNMSESDARMASIKEEMGSFGHKVDGVYSGADIEANLSGRQFYRDLKQHYSQYQKDGGDPFAFDIRNYSSWTWNENKMKNNYTPSLDSLVSDR